MWLSEQVGPGEVSIRRCNVTLRRGGILSQMRIAVAIRRPRSLWKVDWRGLTESRWDTNDETGTGSKLCSKVDFATWVALSELDAWDGISGLDHVRGFCLEGFRGEEALVGEVWKELDRGDRALSCFIYKQSDQMSRN